MVYRRVAVLSALPPVSPVVGADAAGEPAVAALQVALLRAGACDGAVDGVQPLPLLGSSGRLEAAER